MLILVGFDNQLSAKPYIAVVNPGAINKRGVGKYLLSISHSRHSDKSFAFGKHSTLLDILK